MTSERSYVLGTHDDEIERLGLQHRVWRPHMLDAWRAAGITAGSRVADLGAGPGYVTADLAEVVGPEGEVLAVERSARFAAYARERYVSRGLNSVRFIEADLAGPIPSLPTGFDAVWCRWVASFVGNVPALARHAAHLLRPGGRAVFHEYLDYARWSTIPRLPSLDAFVAAVMASWRANGGEPDVAPALLGALRAADLEIVETRPLVFVVDPRDYMWQWPKAFVVGGSQHLVDSGHMTAADAERLQRDFLEFEMLPDARQVTPIVLEIVAQKRGGPQESDR